jgi:cell division protein FtsL
MASPRLSATPFAEQSQLRRPIVTPGAVVKPDVGNRRGAGVWAFLLALCTAGALAHVAVRMHGIQIAYALGRERRSNTELEEQRRRLNIEIGMLKDPDRVIGIARETLRMGPPASENVVRVGSGSLVRPAAPAETVTAGRAPRAHAGTHR